MSFLFGGKKGSATVHTVIQNTQKKPNKPTQAREDPKVVPARASPHPSKALSVGNKRPTPRSSPKPAAVARERIASSRSRNSSTPTQQFSSDSESSEEDNEIDLAPARKRARVEESDLDRKLCAIDDEVAEAEREISRLVESADVTSKDTTSGLRSAFDSPDEVQTVELQYPSRYPPERFQLVYPRQEKDYRPVVDIIETIEQIALHHFSPSDSKLLLDDSAGYPARLRRALNKQIPADFTAALAAWNSELQSAIHAGTCSTHLSHSHTIPLALADKIYWQTYARTVSPHVDRLRRYNAGTDDVYGELLPRFVHDIIRDTGLRSAHTFVDLGSGVGNAVLQAALEAGCEAWGCELEPTRARLAEEQARDFRARCRMWGLRIGRIGLVEGDFTKHPKVVELIPRADVILVNNEKFQPRLNDALLRMFLDLKDGARIVSLKSFAPEGRKVTERNENSVANMLRSKRKFFGSDSVSWTDSGGEYHVAVKVPYEERVNGKKRKSDD
ncbi:histone-lysine N-methyltransferase, H3 lysine-79 specific [Viridothelium virens]|uniref:Histone-lysine N-methyltransferase, H3 lysine-79 specific n=1 Tax=Viridothelium virens TaxID=1048519 RepID=A0A6A6HLU5_VIRVR|nr:histone-lysine N-methyltransferase, H3 lysine-79 specific [Viridothelium virens]